MISCPGLVVVVELITTTDWRGGQSGGGWLFVMAGLDPAIHVFLASVETRTWIPGTSPGMTETF
jgi:hypothetical protein